MSAPEKSRGSGLGLPTVFAVGPWTVDAERLTLTAAFERRRVTPRAMAVLVHLVRRYPHVVSTDELLESVWHGRVVGDNTVHQAVSSLRRVLQEGSAGENPLESIPKRGYRLTLPPSKLSTSHGEATSTPNVKDSLHEAAASLIEQAWYRLARTGDPRKSLELVERALSIDSDLSEALAARAELLYRIPDLTGGLQPRPMLEQAMIANRDALAADPENSRAWYTQGQLCATLQLNFPAASSAYEKSEAYGFDRTAIRIQQAALRLWSRSFSESLAIVQEAEHVQPDNASAKEYLARCLFHAGDVHGANAKWDEALRLEPRNRYILHMALRHSLIAEDAPRTHRLLDAAAVRGYLGQRWALPWLEALQGNAEPMQHLLMKWDRDGKGPRILSCLASHALGDFARHLRWWSIRERDFVYLHTTMLETSFPRYWEKLEQWAVDSSSDHTERRERLDEHWQRIERIASSIATV